MAEPAGSRRRSWPGRLGWLVLIWAIGVGSLALAAGVLKLLMRAAGLTA